MAQHISVRVPWHDDGWDGTVCQNPGENNVCLRLTNISEKKDNLFEQSICGQCMAHNEENLPCISEGSAFMSDSSLVRTTIHPYRQLNKATHGHFLPTKIVYPAYSFATKPFAWMMLGNIEKKQEEFGIDFKSEREPMLGFETSWIQEAKNHQAIFDAFYGDVVPDQSLVIAYAKQVPFVEAPRLVIIAMEHVKKYIPSVEHEHTDDNSLRLMTWEGHICHYIRPDHKDGFVIPYQEMMEYTNFHPDFDMSSIAVFAPDDVFEEFSSCKL